MSKLCGKGDGIEILWGLPAQVRILPSTVQVNQCMFKGLFKGSTEICHGTEDLFRCLPNYLLKHFS